MAQPAPLDPPDRRAPTLTDPLEAVLALCAGARPAPGGEEARELSRLLACAARAGGPAAHERITQALAGVDWWTAPPAPVAELVFDPHEAPDRPRDERRLVDKLAETGRLRPGLLLSALAQSRPALFHAAFAALSGCERAALEPVVAGSPTALALALRAAGLDRAAFPAVMGGLQAITSREAADPASTHPVGPEVAAALALAPAVAAARLAGILRA